MFEKFQDYMYYLLYGPLKKIAKSKNQFYILFKVFGKIFDQTKKDIFMVREESMIISASNKMLEEHGRDRKMRKFKDEDIENYRVRLSMKNIIAEKAGMNEGILLALKALGYEKAYINPVWIRNTERWAEFDIFIDEVDIDLLKNFNIVKASVMDVKQASSLPNYGFSIKLNNKSNQRIDAAASIHRITMNFFNNRILILDGSWILDGSELLGGNEESIELHESKIINRITCINTEEFVSKITIQKNLWRLDGNVMLEGNKNLNAEETEEVL